MGTTSEKLTYLNTTKTLIKEELNLGGANITNEPFRQYKSKLHSIYKDFLAHGTDTLWNNWEKVSGTGETLSLTPTIKGKMKVDLKGNTQQNGTPTPDTPIPVQVVSGDNEINVCGANVWDEQWELGTFNTTTGVDIDLATQIRSKNLINIFPSTLYYFRNPTSPNTKYWIMFYDKEGNIITGYNPSTNNGISGNSFRCDTSQPTIMTPTNAPKMKFYLTLEYGTTYNNDICINVNNASINGNYYSYEGATYPISLGNIELCKIGDYQDKIFKNTPNSTYYDSNLEDNVWYLNKQIGKVVLDGSNDENWLTYGTSTTGYYRNGTNVITNKVLIPLETTIKAFVLCNYYDSKSADDIFYSREQGIAIGTTGLILVYDNTYNSSDNTAFKTWLSTHNTIVYYPLATPTTTEITDSTLLSQLEALAYSYDEQTNISQVNDDMPFILDLTALKEMS